MYKIDSILVEQHLDRAVLADNCGITVGTISHWKMRNSLPGVETLFKISKFLGVTMEWLLSDDISDITEQAYMGRYKHLSKEDRTTVNDLIDSLSKRENS